MKKEILWIMQLVCIIFVFSCNTKKSISAIEKVKCNDCENYKLYIVNNWKIDTLGMYFFEMPPDCEEPIYGKTGVSYTMIVGRNCLIGHRIDEVKTLFGTPSKVYPNRFDYYMTPKCNGKAHGDSPNIDGCIRLQVYFDENKKVVGVSGMIRE